MLELTSPTPPPSSDPDSAAPSASQSPADLEAKIKAKGLPDIQLTRLSVVIAEMGRDMGKSVSLKTLGLPIALPTASVLKPFTVMLSALPSNELGAKLRTLREYIEWICDAPESAK